MSDLCIIMLNGNCSFIVVSIQLCIVSLYGEYITQSVNGTEIKALKGAFLYSLCNVSLVAFVVVQF